MPDVRDDEQPQDITFHSTVRADRLRFTAPPRTAVRFPGTGSARRSAGAIARTSPTGSSPTWTTATSRSTTAWRRACGKPGSPRPTDPASRVPQVSGQVRSAASATAWSSSRPIPLAAWTAMPKARVVT